MRWVCMWAAGTYMQFTPGAKLISLQHVDKSVEQCGSVVSKVQVSSGDPLKELDEANHKHSLIEESSSRT